MAENHLDYDYLEDEAIDEHFAEDPVGVGMSSLCGERCWVFFCIFICLRAFVRAPVEDDGHSARRSTSLA